MKALFLITAMLLLAGCGAGCHTEVSINGNEFYINGEPTFKGKTWRGMKIQGLLPNARLVNGIFDDNKIYVGLSRYPGMGCRKKYP